MLTKRINIPHPTEDTRRHQQQPHHQQQHTNTRTHTQRKRRNIALIVQCNCCELYTVDVVIGSEATEERMRRGKNRRRQECSKFAAKSKKLWEISVGFCNVRGIQSDNNRAHNTFVMQKIIFCIFKFAQLSYTYNVNRCNGIKVITLYEINQE